MSISINLTEGEVSLLLSSLNYLNEEQEVLLTHKHGSVQVIYDKLYFAHQEMQGDSHHKSLTPPHRPLNGFGNVRR
tara:strand:+ start:82 stop:309 length:228 start_codon:yes stop_codon:yes gene_type:complete